MLQFDRKSSCRREGDLEDATACNIAERPSLWIRFLFLTVSVFPKFKLVIE